LIFGCARHSPNKFGSVLACTKSGGDSGKGGKKNTTCKVEIFFAACLALVRYVFFRISERGRKIALPTASEKNNY
jgi:hypothetical protein